MRKKQQNPEHVVQVVEVEDSGEISTTTGRKKRKRADMHLVKAEDIVSTLTSGSRTTRSSYKRSLLVETTVVPNPDPPTLLPMAPIPPSSPPPLLDPITPSSALDTVSPLDLPLILPSSNVPASVTVTAPTNVTLDEPESSEELKSMYQVSDKILCYFNGLLYDAVILEMKSVEEHAAIGSDSPIKVRSFNINPYAKTDGATPDLDQFIYFIHYRHWNSNWDEWVRSDCLKSITDESRKEQLKLKSSVKKAKKPKTTRTRRKRRFYGKSGASRTSDMESIANEDCSGAEWSAATTPVASPSRVDPNADSREDFAEENNVVPVTAPGIDADVALVVGEKTSDDLDEHLSTCGDSPSQKSNNCTSLESNISSLSPPEEVEKLTNVELPEETEVKEIEQPTTVAVMVSSDAVAAVVVHSDEPKIASESEPISFEKQYLLCLDLARH